MINSFSNGIMMGDVPVMTGTWVNPNTGNRFTVKECLMEDSQWVVYTTDGRRIGYDMLQNYVRDVDAKSDKDISVLKTSPKTEKPTHEAYNKMLEGLVSPDDAYLADEALNKPITSTPHPEIQQSSTPEYDILDRAFKKIMLPQVKTTLSWDKKSLAQVQTLNEMMGISLDTITEYLMRKLGEEIHKSVSIAVESQFDKISK